MECDHCTRKECSKKTKSDDQENAAVNVQSPAQENGEKGEFCKLANAKISLSDCLACDSCVTAEEGVQDSQQNTKDFFRVLNLSEMVQIMEQSDLASNDTAVDTLFGDMKEKEVRLLEGASSDGYQAHIFMQTAKELSNQDVGVLTYHTLRNKDFQEVTLERDGEVLRSFEAAYGFQNTQSGPEAGEGQVPLPLRGGPGLRRACLSGRGQAQADDGYADRALLQRMEGIYDAIPVWPPETSAHVQELCQEWLGWGLGGDSPQAQAALHTA